MNFKTICEDTDKLIDHNKKLTGFEPISCVIVIPPDVYDEFINEFCDRYPTMKFEKDYEKAFAGNLIPADDETPDVFTAINKYITKRSKTTGQN